MAAFWRTVTFFDRARLTPWLAVRNTVGIVLPIAVGAFTGNLLSGLAVATGALNVAFSDSHGPYYMRAQRMLTACLLVALAVFAGGLIAHNNTVALTTTTVWAFIAGLVVSLGAAAADVGTISLVTLIVFAARPVSFEKAVLTGLLALAGGLLESALSLAMWRLRRYQPERRALAAFYSELADTTSVRVSTSAAPPVTNQSLIAHQTLAGLSREHTVEAERYQLLLIQAERIRVSLLAIDGLRRRLLREGDADGLDARLAAFYEQAGRALQEISTSLFASGSSPARNNLGPATESATGALRAHRAKVADAVRAAVLDDVLHQVDALNGQLRAAGELAFSSSPEGTFQFQQREARQPWMLRLGGRLATLRANLNLNSVAFRHAVRLSACVAIAEAVGRYFHLERSYWMPMTIAIVLKPDFAATFSRGVLRLAGTFAGLLLATGLYHFLPDSVVAQIALLAALLFALRWIGPANYGIFVAAISGIVVVLVALTGVPPREVVAARGLNTLYGGALALAAYWAWPTWERGQISESLARMLDGYREYFAAVNRRFIERGEENRKLLENTRIAARLARSNIEASAERFGVEPKTTAWEMTTLAAILASSHRFIHAVMALEAGLRAHHLEGDPALLTSFGRDAEQNLRSMSAMLRHEETGRDVLPDLRARQQSLQRAEEEAGRSHGDIVAATDRITNSLNTLREQVLQWSGR